jgi:hypothetical protein
MSFGRIINATKSFWFNTDADGSDYDCRRDALISIAGIRRGPDAPPDAPEPPIEPEAPEPPDAPEPEPAEPAEPADAAAAAARTRRIAKYLLAGVLIVGAGAGVAEISGNYVSDGIHALSTNSSDAKIRVAISYLTSHQAELIKLLKSDDKNERQIIKIERAVTEFNNYVAVIEHELNAIAGAGTRFHPDVLEDKIDFAKKNIRFFAKNKEGLNELKDTVECFESSSISDCSSFEDYMGQKFKGAEFKNRVKRIYETITRIKSGLDNIKKLLESLIDTGLAATGRFSNNRFIHNSLAEEINVIKTDLRPGDSGPEVRKLQRKLIRLGFMKTNHTYKGKTRKSDDGHYGEMTQEAVGDIQQIYPQVTAGETPGHLGPKTRTKINSLN